jgi:hypothetical protein
MRLPLIARADLSPEQRPVYEDMRAGIEQNFQTRQRPSSPLSPKS